MKTALVIVLLLGGCDTRRGKPPKTSTDEQPAKVETSETSKPAKHHSHEHPHGDHPHPRHAHHHHPHPHPHLDGDNDHHHPY